MLLHLSEQAARDTVVGVAWTYAQEAKEATLSRSALVDVHGLAGQRFYNLLCMTYGAENACTRSWHLRTRRSKTCCPENCRAVREATGGRGTCEGTRVIDRQSLQGGEAIADGLVSKTEIVHGARSRSDRGAQ